MKEGKFTEDLSIQSIVDCAKPDSNSVCKVPYYFRSPKVALYRLLDYGIPSDSCYPYTTDQLGKGECITDVCPSGKQRFDFKFEEVARFYYENGGFQRVQKEIELDGPVVTTMKEYSDLKNNNGEEVYAKDSDAIYKGYHYVKLVGWGQIDEAVEAGEPFDKSHYWIVASPWGSYFANNGFIKVRFDQEIAGTLYKIHAKAD